MNYEFHPLANIFPSIPDSEFNVLKADIEQNGLHEPIWLYENKVIDGRHRLRACSELGIEPQTRVYTGNHPASFIISLNLHRRQMSSSQSAAVALEALPYLEDEAKKRQIESGKNYGKGKVVEQIPQPIEKADVKKSRDVAAEKFETNPRYVQDAKKIKQEAPDVFEKILSGDITITQAKREIKEAKREERREENRKLIEQAPAPVVATSIAKFATIVIDPPWDWGDEGDADQLGRARPTYGTMTLHDLLELPVGDMSDVDCHIYLWITNRSLPKGFQLLERWGFRYVTALTWCKPSIGMGNYFRGSTEHILFGVKGSQQLKRKDVGTWFQMPRGPHGHSSKPEELYSLVESCSPGPYLEMFARSNRKNWTSWGAEVSDI